MPKKAAPKTEKKPVAPSFKQLVRWINSGDKPRGLKAIVNDDGGYTFMYGGKNTGTAVVASKDEVAAIGLASLGLKL